MQKITVHMDYETYSEVDLKKVGAFIYANHPSTEVICLYYTYDDGDPVQWLPGMPPPDFVTNPHKYEFRAWNSFFEYCISLFVLGWVSISDLTQWYDTMAAACAAALPASLDGCGEALKMPADMLKSKRGKLLIKRLSKPQKKTKNKVQVTYRNELKPDVVREDYPANKTGEKEYKKQLEVNAMYQEFYDYCAQDVVAERAITAKIRPLSLEERQVWILDQRINLRGVPVSRELIHSAKALRDRAFAPLIDEVQEITFGELENTNKLDELKEYLTARGFDFPSLAKDKMHEALAREDLPADVRRLLEIRQETGKTSLAKFEALEKYLHTDDRVRGLFMYWGAATGRWAGRGPQPQNLPRPVIGDPRNEEEQADLIQAVCDILPQEDLELMDMLFDSVGDALASCVRSMFVAGEGKILRALDFSSIEARVLAWLAKQDDLLDVFRKGDDVYKHAASGIYGVKIADVTKDQRQIGKVSILALGYQGSVGAFQSMAANYFVTVPDDQAKKIVKDWRRANKKIVNFWYRVDEAAIMAVLNPGEEYRVNDIRFKKLKNFLYIKLPSGRLLSYYRPRIKPGKFGDQLWYWGMKSRDGGGTTWQLIDTYGGKLVENITQAVARDLLAEAMLRLEARGYSVVMHVHDEVVTEDDITFGSIEEMEEIVLACNDWAKDIPMGAEGFETKRYRK